MNPILFISFLIFGLSASEKPSKDEICIETSEHNPSGFLGEVQEEECTFEDIELFGKVKFVDSSPDLKIQFVTSFPDIKVKFVSSFPDDCGEWKVVDSFPDFRVQVVERSADLKVKVVHSFPGMD